jgi:FkbM family methyltransferase
MDIIRDDSPTARLLAAAVRFEDFTLADVGCSGGIDAGWRAFGDRLKAFAFDPGLDEIRRLSAAEVNPNIRYIAGFVGLPDGHPFKNAAIEPWLVDPWWRLSACRTRQLQQAQAEAEARAAPATAQPPAADQRDLMERSLWHEDALEKADQTIVLPQFLDTQGVDRLDFLKIDVDGADFEILRSLDEALSSKRVLGAMLEVSFHGSDNEHFNTFHNTDRFMRAHGFDLFALTTRPYSLAALPRPFQFAYPFGAQTTQGRPLQGDALYLRDYGHARPDRDLSSWSDDQLLKLGALYALFGLIDAAAGLVLHFRERLQARLDVDAALDVMTQETQDSEPELWTERRFASYGDYIAAYEADDRIFYGANARRAEVGQRVIRERDEARAELAAARRDLAETQERLRAAQAQAGSSRFAFWPRAKPKA